MITSIDNKYPNKNNKHVQKLKKNNDIQDEMNR
jgi:hypothetical protein